MPIHYNGDVTDDEHRQRYEWVVIPSYSTDIAAAWEMVERLSQDFGVQINVLYPEAGNGDRFCCKIWREHSLQFRSLFVSSAPLAICRAFLKANGVESVEVPNE